MKKGVLFLFMTLIFAGVSAGLYFGVAKPQRELKDVAENGTDGIGYLINIKSNTEVNDEKMYRLIFRYMNDDGEMVDAETWDVYSMRELSDMELDEDAKLDIRYIGDKAVVMPYKAGVMGWLGFVLVLVFGGIALLMLVLAILDFRGGAVAGKLKKTGTDGTATYLSHSSNLIVNGVRKYKIKYSYPDESGNYTEGKTGSNYEQHEAEAFAVLRTFPIKFSGKKSVVMLDKQQLMNAANDRPNQAYSQPGQSFSQPNQAYSQPYQPFGGGQNQPYGQPDPYGGAPNQAYSRPAQFQMPDPYQTQTPAAPTASATPAAPFAPASGQNAPLYCKQCGARMYGEAKFCPGCGAKKE